MKNSQILILCLLIILQILIYIPYVGEGFIRDDFIWLENIVPDGKVDYLGPFIKTTGFFRPMVSLTFGLQYQIHGLHPKPFGLFNLFLHLLNIILVYLLLAGQKETKRYALGAAILFAMNAKAAGMAVGWISGRTTLLVSFFLLLSLYSFFRLSNKNPVRLVLTVVFYFASLLSKETAAAAPIFIFFFVFLTCHESHSKKNLINMFKKGLGASAVFIVPLIIYFLLRFNSNAMTPFNAPDYYKYNLSPLLLFENLIEYIIRAALLDIYVIFLFIALILGSFVWLKNKPDLKKSFDSSAFYMGILWFVSFLLVSLPIPVRSNLYSYFPQVGLHISALAILFVIWRKLIKNKIVLQNAALIFMCLLLLGWGRYLFTKSASYGKYGKISAQFTEQVVRTVSEMPSGAKVYIIDRHYGEDFSPSKIIAYGFNSLLNLYYPQKHFRGEIISPTESIKMKTDPVAFFFIWENRELNPRLLD